MTFDFRVKLPPVDYTRVSFIAKLQAGKSLRAIFMVFSFPSSNPFGIEILSTVLIADALSTLLLVEYKISRKLYTTTLFIKIDFTLAGHHQLDLKTISIYFRTKISIKPINRL